MAAKDYFLSSKHSFIHNGNKKYSNLNLNQNSDLYGDMSLRKKLDFNYWRKSNVYLQQNSLKTSFNRGESSCLSRNILFCERSFDTENDPIIGAAADLKKSKWEKHIMEASIQNVFEYPRQQNDENTEPEIMGYIASQQLLDPKKEELTEEIKLKKCGTSLTPEKLEELKRQYADYLFKDKLQNIEEMGVPPIGTFVNGFEIICYIGVGGYGAVVLAERNDLFYAIKFSEEENLISFKEEYDALEKNLESPHHSNLLTACFFGSYVYEKDVSIEKMNKFEKKQKIWMMAMKLTGLCFENFECEQKQPEAIKFRNYLSALKALEAFHQCGNIHRDIKHENFAVDINDESKMYVLDYGLVKLATDRKKDGKSGTCTYESRAAARGEEQSYKDDTESWANMLFEFVYGEIPWDIERDGETPEEVQEKFWKAEDDTIHKQLRQIILHINSLKSDKKANYEFIADCLQLYADEKYGHKTNVPYEFGKSTKGERTVNKGKCVFIKQYGDVLRTTLKCEKCGCTIYVQTSKFNDSKDDEEVLVIDSEGKHFCK